MLRYRATAGAYDQGRVGLPLEGVPLGVSVSAALGRLGHWVPPIPSDSMGSAPGTPGRWVDRGGRTWVADVEPGDKGVREGVAGGCGQKHQVGQVPDGLDVAGELQLLLCLIGAQGLCVPDALFHV